MKRKNIIKLTSLLAAAILVAIGFIIKLEIKNRSYKTALQNGYSKSLDDFGTAINNISLSLNKARFVTTPKQVSTIAAKLLCEAELSKSALSQLPQGEELPSLNLFLSQVGNYALSVSNSLISGEKLNADQVTAFENLNDTANKICELVTNSQITFNNSDYWASELDEKIEKITKSHSLSNNLTELDDQLSDYPTLIYDGPYSDHILEKEPNMIKNAPKVSQDEALKTALKVAQCEKSVLEFSGLVEGDIPSYRFSGSNITVTISQNGGYAVNMRKTVESGNTALSYQQAREKSKRYLAQMGMHSFTETYYFTTEGVCVVNFAFLDGETICYTDLVKVGVALDSGEIVFYEASGYLTNHQTRAFVSPKYTATEAEKQISRNLTVKSTALALIPTNHREEMRCYEFHCTSADGQEVLIYINTQTLEEEDILILLKSDGGTLVK